MEDTQESDVRTINLCHSCCNPLKPMIGKLKYRRASESADHYPGTLAPAAYFWCELCNKAYMAPEQCDRDITREQARNGQLVFVITPMENPPKKVHVVDWLRE